MTEWKTLKELWKENGEKPFDAVSDDGWFHCVAICPDTRAIGWDKDGHHRWCPGDAPTWKLAPKEPKLVPHWPAVFYVGKHPSLSDVVYPTIDDVHAAYPSAPAGSVRLATELPPIMLEVEE